MCSSWGAFCDRNETRLICLSHVPSRSDAVISWASKLLPQSLFVMYEQMHPGDPFGRVMQNHFLKLNSTLHGLRRYPDAAAQRRRFLEQASARDNLCTFGGSFCLCTRGFEMWSLSSGLGAVRVSGYEPLLPRDGARGGETQGGEPGAV